MALPQAMSKRRVCRIPRVVDERLAMFLGYLIGDGHVSRVKRNVGLTTADQTTLTATAYNGTGYTEGGSRFDYVFSSLFLSVYWKFG